jgi:ATP-dependent Lon protease
VLTVKGKMPTPTAAPLNLELEVPVLTLPDGVLFPGSVMRFELGTPATIVMAQDLASKHEAVVAVFTQKDPAKEPALVADLHATGTVARVVALAKLASGMYGLVLQGVARVEIDSLTTTLPFLQAKVHQAREIDEGGDELEALHLSLRESAHEVIDLLRLPGEAGKQIDGFASPGPLADFIAHHMEGTLAEKITLLDLLDVKARVRAVLARMVRRTEMLKMKNRINAQVQGEMGKTQREHVLRQQMKAIQAELGQGEEDGNDFDALQQRILDAKLPPEARSVAEKQLKRLREMSASSPEFAQVRTYLDWLVELPWTQATDDNADIASVRAVLDADHYGLQKVKRRILEFLAVRKLKSDKKGPILCLVGPPGVGKTSLGRSIAGALGRKFHRISLGGVHDEAAIRGHRRTYVGALPGNVIQGLKKVGVTNPVFMLDEVDKLGSGGMRGDPSSALLEVLDPEQNDTFTDHYLEIPYDLSSVMFVATANVVDTIPPPLRDRMEIIEIPGYTRLEKLAIARRHLVPKQLDEHGISASQLDITDEALARVIERYTREAGVRALEKKIAAIVRGVAVQIAEGRTEPVVVRSEDDLRAFVGPAPYSDETIERTSDPGVATGLAWTPVGGQILFVEASRMPGHGKLTLTGQLGDVMKESAEAALSYVRSNAQRWGIPKDFLQNSDLHIHVPAGGLPKDGPSAGVTMLTALVSLLTGVCVRHDVAMTGEITLRGRVLPIGGLKEKVLAAHRAGIKRVIVPERNVPDLEEVPDEIKRDLEIVAVSTMAEVIEAALEASPVSPRVTSFGAVGTPSAAAPLAG